MAIATKKSNDYIILEMSLKIDSFKIYLTILFLTHFCLFVYIVSRIVTPPPICLSVTLFVSKFSVRLPGVFRLRLDPQCNDKYGYRQRRRFEPTEP